MANYKNTRGRSYAQQRRSSSGGILKTLGAVLVVFLAIALIGSLFSRPSDSADADKKDPTTATNPTEAPQTINFKLVGTEYEALEGMTFAEWLATNPEFKVERWFLDDDGILDADRGFGGVYLYEGTEPVGDLVLGTTVIQDGREYNPY